MPPLGNAEIWDGRAWRGARDLTIPMWPSKADRQEQLRTFFDMQSAAGVGNDMGDAAMSGASAAAPVVSDAAQAGASAAMSGAQAAAPMVQDAASGAASAVMSGAQSAAPMVGDAASGLASSVGDAASNIAGDDNGCFPAGAMVHHRRRGFIRMEDVRLGDDLECGGGDFSPVIAMLHRSPGTKMTYLRLHHEVGTLAISADHLVCTKGAGDESSSWRWVPAARVRLGDLLQLHPGQVVAVLSVSKDQDLGLFAPLTLCSSILVDGVLCSCFSPPQDLRLSHELCHRAMMPLRFWHLAKKALETTTTVNLGDRAVPLLTLEAVPPLRWTLCDATVHPYADALLFALRWLTVLNAR